MKSSIHAKLDKLAERLHHLDYLLRQEEALNNIDNFRKMKREYAELYPIIKLYRTYLKATNDIVLTQELLTSDIKDLAQEEIQRIKIFIESLETKIYKMLVSKDTDDKRNIFLEIRAATGGNESALFAKDLLRMYTRFAERKSWKIEIISTSESEIGGYRVVIMRIIGYDAYSQLKFESGGHRVQRVPTTETQGRIHTSTCTIAVIPEATLIEETSINPTDIRIDTFRATGAGGQHINKTDSAVRITHIPTSIVVECQNDRSQHKNKAFALKVLAARIKDSKQKAQQLEQANTRKLLIGSGDRSERIRTYNFPQGRITDHRINLTLYKLNLIMDGDLEKLTSALINEYQTKFEFNVM